MAHGHATSRDLAEGKTKKGRESERCCRVGFKSFLVYLFPRPRTQGFLEIFQSSFRFSSELLGFLRCCPVGSQNFMVILTREMYLTKEVFDEGSIWRGKCLTEKEFDEVSVWQKNYWREKCWTGKCWEGKVAWKEISKERDISFEGKCVRRRRCLQRCRWGSIDLDVSKNPTVVADSP